MYAVFAVFTRNYRMQFYNKQVQVHIPSLIKFIYSRKYIEVIKVQYIL